MTDVYRTRFQNSELDCNIYHDFIRSHSPISQWNVFDLSQITSVKNRTFFLISYWKYFLFYIINLRQSLPLFFRPRLYICFFLLLLLLPLMKLRRQIFMYLYIDYSHFVLNFLINFPFGKFLSRKMFFMRTPRT